MTRDLYKLQLTHHNKNFYLCTSIEYRGLFNLTRFELKFNHEIEFQEKTIIFFFIQLFVNKF